MEELKKKFEGLILDVKSSRAKLGLEDAKNELKVLNAEMESPDFWKDRSRAQEISKKAASLGNRIDP